MGLVDFRSQAVTLLSKMRPNATFLTIHNYMNAFGEISNFSIAFHVSYPNAVKRSKELLVKFIPTAEHCVGRPYSPDHLRIARDELLDSYDATLSGHNPAATSAHAYDEVQVGNATIPGIKLHREQDILHLWGFGLHKKVLLPGNYPEDTRRVFTIAKDDLRLMTPLGKFVQFRLQPGRFHQFVVEGITIKEDQVIREVHDRLSKPPTRW